MCARPRRALVRLHLLGLCGLVFGVTAYGQAGAPEIIGSSSDLRPRTSDDRAFAEYFNIVAAGSILGGGNVVLSEGFRAAIPDLGETPSLTATELARVELRDDVCFHDAVVMGSAVD